jgi:hypothetical protein
LQPSCSPWLPLPFLGLDLFFTVENLLNQFKLFKVLLPTFSFDLSAFLFPVAAILPQLHTQIYGKTYLITSRGHFQVH